MRAFARSFLGSVLALALTGGCSAPAEPIGEASAAQTGEQRIHASAGFLGASPDDRAKIDVVARGAGPTAKEHLAELLERSAERLLGDRDKDGQTTLENLAALAGGASHPKITALSNGFTAPAIRDAVLGDVAHPERIHQGKFQTCQITCLQYALASAYPSEFVRLMRGLTGPTGKVRMRKGDELALYDRYLVPKANDDRSASEAIFQTSVMDEITGSYDPQTDRSKLLFVSYPGNSTHMAEDTFEQLFGDTYDVKGQSDLQVVLDPKSTMARDAAASFLRSVQVKRPPAIVDAMMDGGSNSHSLVVLRVEGDRVFFRNPWGPQHISDNSGRVEDESASIYSMTVDELARRMQTHIAPR